MLYLPLARFIRQVARSGHPELLFRVHCDTNVNAVSQVQICRWENLLHADVTVAARSIPLAIHIPWVQREGSEIAAQARPARRIRVFLACEFQSRSGLERPSRSIRSSLMSREPPGTRRRRRILGEDVSLTLRTLKKEREERERE